LAHTASELADGHWPKFGPRNLPTPFFLAYNP